MYKRNGYFFFKRRNDEIQISRLKSTSDDFLRLLRVGFGDFMDR